MTWPEVAALAVISAAFLIPMVVGLTLDLGPSLRNVDVRPREPAPMWRVESRPLHLCRRCRRRNQQNKEQA